MQHSETIKYNAQTQKQCIPKSKLSISLSGIWPPLITDTVTVVEASTIFA